jgi:hypothetical protein
MRRHRIGSTKPWHAALSKISEVKFNTLLLLEIDRFSRIREEWLISVLHSAPIQEYPSAPRAEHRTSVYTLTLASPRPSYPAILASAVMKKTQVLINHAL